MEKIPGYKLLEKLKETKDFLIFKAMKKHDETTFIIKVLKSGNSTPEKISNFYREFHKTDRFENEGVIKVYEILKTGDSAAIIMEDINGQSLADILNTMKLSLDEFLNLAVQITEAIGNIHKRNIIHKDINPSNIIWNIEKNLVRIIDFGISTELPREITSVKSPSILEGTLSYISPEQTGRMNRSLDYRTDFYSLGITFYQMLTGQLPFESKDLLKLVHSHIAVIAKSPYELDKSIPKAVSDIVMKLMDKNAENRYQRAFGLNADLKRCQKEIENSGIINTFKLGLHDVSDRFQVPQKLYGREQETVTLMSAFERVRNNGTELMLVSGFSGIGKSLLINEIQRPLVKHQGYFISGKFERLKKDVPYSAIIQAFTELANQIFAEGDAKIAVWKKKISTVLGPNGKLITDVLPVFELIIGKQPEVPELGPIESQNRFNLVFQGFIKALASREHPLVLFLDDLQWADLASLHLLKLFTTNFDIKHLFIIGAYRHNETPDSHPLILTLDEIRKTGAVVNNIFLQPLNTEHVSQLLGDTLNCPIVETNLLADALIRKTSGNPFFLNEFLKSLHKESLFEFSFEKGWSWHMAEIEKIQATDNVVNLMAGKIADLPYNSQEILKMGACIGSYFKIKTLVTICDKSEEDILPHLNEVIQAGMLNKIDDIYRFSHDRVLEAAYSLISNKEKMRQHYHIGNLELNNSNNEELKENIFYIVNQLNAGAGLVFKESEKLKLAELNLMAGGKALASNAYVSSLNYLKAGIGLLEKNCWEENYSFVLALYQEASVAAQLSADYEAMDKFADEVLRNAETTLDKIKVYEAKIFACMARNQLLEGIRTGLQVLRQLGIRMPEKPGNMRIAFELLFVKLSLTGKSVESLANLPKIENPHKLAVMRILSRIGLPAYIAAPELFPLIVFHVIKLSIKYGNSIYSPYSYAAFGVIHCGVLGQTNAGYEWGKLALNLVEKFNIKDTKSRVWFVVWYVINHWKRPLHDSLKPFLEAYKIGLETGDLEFAAFSADAYSNLFHLGIELTDVEKEMVKLSETIRMLNQDTILNYHLMHHQTVLNLMGMSDNPCKLAGSSYDESKMLPVHKDANDNLALFFLYFYLLNLNYLFENNNEALKYAELVEPHSKEQISHPYLPIINFYDSLVRLAFYSTATKTEQKKLLKKVTKNQKIMKKWASHAPMNYSQKYHLVKAEIARVRGHKLKAIDHYNLAVKLACENKFLQDEALSMELTSKFWIGLNEEAIASVYMTEACRKYRAWGAAAKIKQLEEKYHTLIASQAVTQNSSIIEKTISIDSSTNNISKGLDLSSIMKSANAFASILNLKELLKRIIEITMENAGATNGFLLLKKDNAFFIEAELNPKGAIKILQSQPVDEACNLAVSAIDYVLHTQKYIVLDDAVNQGNFTSDPWIKKNKIKSLLVSAILRHGKVTGVFYAENNIVNGAFTEERLKILRLLSTQAAISLENSQLFENIKKTENEIRELNISLEKRVEERTEKLNQTLETVEKANRHIMSSIRYSSVIQQSLLPDPQVITDTIPNSFFIWQPRDIIGGDIYYFEKLGSSFIIAVIDCTGHGVPGAFMTMVASSGLRRIINEEANFNPAFILKKLNFIIKTSLQQDKEHSQSDDGLDAGVCHYDGNSDVVRFAGAKLGLYYIDDSELKIIKGDKTSIGYVSSDLDYKFTEHTINNASNKFFYMTTDGFTDQLGGEKKRRLGSRKFKNYILKNHKKPFETQKELLCSGFDKHLGKNERTDDVTVAGFKPEAVLLHRPR